MNFLANLFNGANTTLSAEAAHDRLNGAQPPFLLDVRSQEEFAEVRVQGAKLIPLGELPKRMGELPRERDIIVMCRSGARSGAAVGQLKAAGFTVYNLEGGITAWVRRGYAVLRGR
jgi:rhodanese-related sulfurtransferase